MSEPSGVPIGAVEHSEFSTAEIIVIGALGVFLSAALIIASNFVFNALLLSCRGLGKAMLFFYRAYTLVWDVSVFVVRLGVLIAILFVLFHLFADEKKKIVSDFVANSPYLARAGPTLSTALAKVQDQAMQLHRNYWDNQH